MISYFWGMLVEYWHLLLMILLFVPVGTILLGLLALWKAYRMKYPK